jgi:murein DD-endopeptidase MepM/ murein hydrolase activator NlpD
MIVFEISHHSNYNNICMKNVTIYVFILPMVYCILAVCGVPLSAQVTPLNDMNYDDEAFNVLLESTTASKNRMLREQRLEEYPPPGLFSYTLEQGEDIWTIIAKTSLNIESITTLNRYDFIGMAAEGKVVFLPDTLGIFFDSAEHDREELSLRFSIEPEHILLVPDPLRDGESLHFLPEVQLPFLERSYLMGVVFHAPLVGVRTSGYGKRIDPFVNTETFHGGVDIASKEGKFVRASRRGRVIYADASNGYGNLVILEHDHGYYTFYGHLGEISVLQDEPVETGHVLGKVGTSGRTTGPHLHFEIRRYERPLNPEDIPFFLIHQGQQ